MYEGCCLFWCLVGFLVVSSSREREGRFLRFLNVPMVLSAEKIRQLHDRDAAQCTHRPLHPFSPYPWPADLTFPSFHIFFPPVFPLPQQPTAQPCSGGSGSPSRQTLTRSSPSRLEMKTEQETKNNARLISDPFSPGLYPRGAAGRRGHSPRMQVAE